MRRCKRAFPDEFGGGMKFVEPRPFANPVALRFNIRSLQTLVCSGGGRFLNPIFDVGSLFDKPSGLVSVSYS
jgi:hypothetical protein